MTRFSGKDRRTFRKEDHRVTPKASPTVAYQGEVTPRGPSGADMPSSSALGFLGPAQLLCSLVWDMSSEIIMALIEGIRGIVVSSNPGDSPVRSPSPGTSEKVGLRLTRSSAGDARSSISKLPPHTHYTSPVLTLPTSPSFLGGWG